MRMNGILNTAIMVMSISAAPGAQSGTAIDKPLMKNDTMTMTYTGCVESVNHDATFLLRPGDDSSTTSARSDVPMKSEVMKKGQMPPDAKIDAAASKGIVLTGFADLKSYVGQQVSVTGSLSSGSAGTMRHDLSTLTIKTLQVVAKSCAAESGR
jgi:hypothetical protein